MPSDSRSGWGSIYTALMVVDWIETWYGFEEHVVADVRGLKLVHKMKVRPPDKNHAIDRANTILCEEFFGFLKVFNADLSDSHTDYFLMEQEWRILNTLPFTVNEVHCIYAQKEYIEQLAFDRPEYRGKIKSPR
jgi:hypothetical protein